VGEQETGEGNVIQKGHSDLYKRDPITGEKTYDNKAGLNKAKVDAEMLGKGMGTMPVGLARMVNKLTEAKVDWRSQLRTQLSRGLGSLIISSWQVPSRRWGNGEYPGTRMVTRPNVWCIVDSVPEYSPVIVDENGLIDIIPISKLTTDWKDVGNGRYVGKSKYKIYSGGGSKLFLPVKNVFRHYYKGKLIRVVTNSGMVDTSPNHSLVRFGGHILINAKNIKKGECLAMPLGYDICGYTRMSDKHSPFFFGNEELAWLYGFFVAEGSAFVSKNNNPKDYEASESYCVSLCNKDVGLLEKAKRIAENFFSSKWSYEKPDEMGVADFVTYNKKVFKFFREKFYTDKGAKRVPSDIFNSPKRIRESFLQGYLAGDGDKESRYYNLYNYSGFTTISQTLAMGIIWLFKTINNNFSYRFYVDNRNKKTAFDIHFRDKDRSRLRPNPREVKQIFEIDYDGWVYDIEVESEISPEHSFCTGIGPIKVHNTSGSISEEQLEQFLSETYAISRNYGSTVSILPFDAQSYEILTAKRPGDIISKVMPKMKGGGGTEIEPAITHLLEERKFRPKDAVVIMSDGDIFDIEEEQVKSKMNRLANNSSTFIFLTVRRPKEELRPHLPRQTKLLEVKD